MFVVYFSLQIVLTFNIFAFKICSEKNVCGSKFLSNQKKIQPETFFEQSFCITNLYGPNNNLVKIVL